MYPRTSHNNSGKRLPWPFYGLFDLRLFRFINHHAVKGDEELIYDILCQLKFKPKKPTKFNIFPKTRLKIRAFFCKEKSGSFLNKIIT